MGKVNTVLGPIATEDLGVTAMHEHIGFGLPGCDLDTQWWKKPEEAFEVTMQSYVAFVNMAVKHLLIVQELGMDAMSNISKCYHVEQVYILLQLQALWQVTQHCHTSVTNQSNILRIYSSMK